MVSNHKVHTFQYLIIKEIDFEFRFKRGYVIRSKGTAIPMQHINTTHAIRRRYVSIVLVAFEIGSFLEQAQ